MNGAPRTRGIGEAGPVSCSSAHTTPGQTRELDLIPSNWVTVNGRVLDMRSTVTYDTGWTQPHGGEADVTGVTR